MRPEVLLTQPLPGLLIHVVVLLRATFDVAVDPCSLPSPLWWLYTQYSGRLSDRGQDWILIGGGTAMGWVKGAIVIK
jgi:hypothetical protein